MAISIKLLRTVARYSFVLLLSKGLTVSASYLLALNVSDKDFGLISLAQAGFATALALLGMNAASGYVRYYYSHGFVPVLLALRRPYLFFALLTSVASLALAFRYQHDSSKIWFSLLPIAGLVASFLTSEGAIFRCANRFAGYAFCELGRPVLVFAVVVAYVLAGRDLPAFPVFVVALLTAVVITFVGSSGMLMSLPRQVSLMLPGRELTAFLFPLVLVQITSLLNNVSDRYFLSAYLPLSQVGMYGKAYLVGSSLGMLFDSVSLLWAPYVMKHRASYFERMHRQAKAGFLLTGSLAVLALLVAILIFNVSFDSERLRKLVVVALIVTAAFLVRIGYQIFVPVLCAFDETKGVARIAAVGAVLGVIANLVLIPLIGIYGAAVATLVSFAATSAGYAFLLSRVRDRFILLSV